MQTSQAVLDQPQEKGGNALSGIFLVAGTCIGAGMLALPVVTGEAGFYPAMFINTVCWLFMLATGLLFLEATLWMKDGANVLSMANRFLGPKGKWIGGISFLFLYYCLMVSYLSGGSPLLANLAHHGLGVSLTGPMPYILFAAVFGTVVFLGAKLVDRINGILMIGLIFSYIFLIGGGSTEVQFEYLSRKSWGLCLFAAPTLFGAYGYHNVIPSLCTYLNRNVRRLRLAIIVGTSIPFVVYSLWQWMIIGSIPLEGISDASMKGVPITETLQIVTGNRWLSTLGVYFGFFALVTSLIGVSLSMVDFLADGLKMQVRTEGLKRIGLCLLVFIPPTLLAIAYPGIFIEAMGYAGGYGEAILNALLPITMVWIGRYHLKLPSQAQLPGGKIVLVLFALFTFLIMGIETHHILTR